MDRLLSRRGLCSSVVLSTAASWALPLWAASSSSGKRLRGIAANETFGGTFPFKPHFYRGSGFRMHYVDEGSGPETILLVHGTPTWSYLYRKFIPGLSKLGRVVVPDHMGFGKSDTVVGASYDLQTHSENLTALIKHLNLKNITLVGHDWGGPIMFGLAGLLPDRIKRVALVNSPALHWKKYEKLHIKNQPRSNAFGVWMPAQLKAKTYRTTMANLSTNILSVMRVWGLANLSYVDDNWIRAYGSRYTTFEHSEAQWYMPLMARGLKPRFREESYIKRIQPGINGLAKLPALMIWGTQDRAMTGWQNKRLHFRTLFPKGGFVPLNNASHFSPEDAPQTICSLLSAFVQIT